MAEGSLDTLGMQHFVRCWQGGDANAADALLRAVGERLEHITRKMLRGFPAVRACTETGDVLQNSLFRLLNTLRRVEPASTRHFFNLAATHIRRELLDLARHFSHPAFCRVIAADATNDRLDGAGPQEAVAPTEDEDLDLWRQFHVSVDALPEGEREVIGLAFYHGWTQRQMADLLQIDERTVRRRWQSACLRLRELVGDKLPRL